MKEVPRPPGSSRLPRLAAVAALAVLCAPAASGQSLGGYAEVTGVRAEETTSFPPFATQQRDLRSWIGRLSFNYDQMLWPNIHLRAGGLFERLRSRDELEGIETVGARTGLQPYLIFRYETPLHQAELGWQRDETRIGTGDAETRLVRDTYGLILAWYPQASSYLRLTLSHAGERDDPRRRFDRDTDRVQLLGAWQPITPLRFDYQGNWSRVEDRIRNSELDTLYQSARVNYADSFWNERLLLGASYDVTWQKVESRRAGQGEVELPVSAVQGLSVLDDFPEDAVLAVNPALIDGNRLLPANVNLGVPLPNADRRLRNIGFDFEIPKAVNGIRVWVNNDLPFEVAQTLTWEVWSSADNVRWTRQRDLGPAPFGPFDPYFELRFGSIAARYLKVVVAPLSPGIPNAEEYRVVEVTELEALVFRDVEGTGTTAESTDHRVYAGAQLQITRSPDVFYNVTYVARLPEGRLASDTLSNVLSLNHRFDRIWAVGGRLAFETGRTLTSGRRNAWLYGASVTSTPIPAFAATLSASGKREEFERGIDQDIDSLFLNTTTLLYRGVNLLASAGVSQTSDRPGRDTDSTTYRVGLELLPHPIATIFLGWDRTDDEITGGGLEPANVYREASEITLSLQPVPSIYIFGSYRIERSSDYLEDRRLTTTSLNWSPFPYGTLRFYFRFEEYYDSLLDSNTRIYGPGARWYINSRSHFDVYWESFETENVLQQNDRETLSATLRIGF